MYVYIYIKSASYTKKFITFYRIQQEFKLLYIKYSGMLV